MTTHEYAQVALVAGLHCGKKTADFNNLVIVQLANLDGRTDVEVFEHRTDLVKSANVFVNVRLVVPAFLQNNGDHGPV